MFEVVGSGSVREDLGGVQGLGELSLDASDDLSLQVDVSAVFEQGFVFGGVTYLATDFYVNINGSVSFGAGLSEIFESLADIALPIIAPFHADVDTRLDGEGPESGSVWVDQDIENDVVTITWDDVGYYRRAAELTNRFQLELHDLDDGRLGIVFRYENVTWTTGNLEGGFAGLGGQSALSGYQLSADQEAVLLPSSGEGDFTLNLDADIGNTGIQGLWVFEYDGVTFPEPEPELPINYILTGTSGNDILVGRDGDDRLVVSAGRDVMRGGAGEDTLDLNELTHGISLEMGRLQISFGSQDVTSFSGMENVRGTKFNDEIWGDDGRNLINGHLGHDQLYGGGGNDILIGSHGNDVLDGQSGNDILNGGWGADEITGGAGNDRLVGESGDDVLLGVEGDNVLLGGIGDDMHLDGGGSSTLYAGAGDDELIGNAGHDRLYGAQGDDVLDGGTGNDRLVGGEGYDVMTGGQGFDWFVFRPMADTDVIRDFHISLDRLFIEDDFWTEELTASEVVSRYASVVDGQVVFEFGNDILIIANLSELSGLEDRLTII